jgi:flavin reductase (DIM6/NTAB) family NADH-FMN oxidoreductase RutF
MSTVPQRPEDVSQLNDWLDDHAPSWRPRAGAPSLEPSLTVEEFRAAFRNHPAGVAVITADPGEGPVGLTATSVFSVSAEPPLVAFSVSVNSSAAPGILRSASVVIHLLGTGQLDLAQLCATSGMDRFADTGSWDRLATGEPYFPRADSWVRAQIIDRLPAGGAVLIVARAVNALVSASDGDSRPLVYHNRVWHGLGEHSELG